jgi:hypothetical protein
MNPNRFTYSYCLVPIFNKREFHLVELINPLRLRVWKVRVRGYFVAAVPLEIGDTRLIQCRVSNYSKLWSKLRFARPKEEFNSPLLAGLEP